MTTKHFLILFMLAIIISFAGCSSDVSSTDGDTDTTDGDSVDIDEPVSDGDIDKLDGEDDTIIIDGDSDTVESDVVETDTESNQSEKTWTDSSTGLTWQKDDFKYTQWQVAIDYCNDLSLDNHDDWYMPDITELRTLLRGCPATETDGSCNINIEGCLDNSCEDNSCVGCGDDAGPDPDGCYWPTELSGGCVMFWSSSVATGSLGDNAWHVNFNYGGVDAGRQGHSNYAICVRK